MSAMPKPRGPSRPIPKRSNPVSTSSHDLFKPLFSESPTKPSPSGSPVPLEPDEELLSPPEKKVVADLAGDFWGEHGVLEKAGLTEEKGVGKGLEGVLSEYKQKAVAKKTASLDRASSLLYRSVLFVSLALYFLPFVLRFAMVSGYYAAPPGGAVHVYDRTLTAASLAEGGWELKKTRLGGAYKLRDAKSGRCLSTGRGGTVRLKRCAIAKAWKMEGGNLVTKKGRAVEGAVGVSLPGWGTTVQVKSLEEAWEFVNGFE